MMETYDRFVSACIDYNEAGELEELATHATDEQIVDACYQWSEELEVHQLRAGMEEASRALEEGVCV